MTFHRFNHGRRSTKKGNDITLIADDQVWRQRLNKIPSRVEDIQFPQADGSGDFPDQDQESCEVTVDGESQRIRFHDYDDVFGIPGLYEELFYERLKCCSPSCIISLLKNVAADFGQQPADLKVLDVGAGNGMVGDELQDVGVQKVVGVDILNEARDAARRDRPDVYQDYIVTDLCRLAQNDEQRLKDYKLNCLTTVAALGYGDIPPEAFLQAAALIDTPGWLAFNLKESFLREDDETGFQKLIRVLCREEYIQIQCYRRYRHRISISGEPLFYVAMICRKFREIPLEMAGEISES